MPKFVPRERKHKRIARQKAHTSTVEDDTATTNAEVILPTSKSEKEEKRVRLQQELRAQQSQEKISGKKRKRLDKYIDTKLKKEENLELLKKLAAQKVDTSLLQSAKKLGRVNESKRERFQRVLRERNAGLDVNGDQDSILFEQRVPAKLPESEQDTDEDDTGEAEVDGAAVIASVQPVVPSFGSGLKRPLDMDDTGNPVIKRRKRRKQARKLHFTEQEEIPGLSEEQTTTDQDTDTQGSEDESEWNGFDSDEHEGQENELILDVPVDSQESEEDSSSSTDGEDDAYVTEEHSGRVSAFKAWADNQRNEAVGFIPSAAPANDAAAKAAFKPRAPSPDHVRSELLPVQTENSYRPSASVVIPRLEEVQVARLELPVVQDEQKIMEAVHHHPVTVVCGATGSGKTTQLPQMLLENGYASRGMIGITQPRRVAATSVAGRVAHELGPAYGKQVAHQVRYDSNVGRDTKIKFMTDGILLREISQDFALSKYSAIVIDEAHERSVNTDILVGMLSRIVPLRQELSREDPDQNYPLKLIIMSATLRVADFLMNDRLFRGAKPPIVQAEGRQYQVTEHFARRTQRDYVAETVNKVSRGHKKLPPGSILVFLTGQDEIQTVAKRLKESLVSDTTGFAISHRPSRDSSRKGHFEEDMGDGSDSEPEITGLDDNDDDDDAEFEVEADPAAPQQRGGMKAHILPLYAALPADQQTKVFQPAPEGSRAIILATNVAETSLTIPGVKYVFDCGRSKEKCYDTSTGVQEFAIDWISKASAAQRMGRAGRTGPGHCYRLYSSAIYEQYFEDHTLPEILRTPIEGTVLQLKNMDVDNVVNFPFPTPPQADQLVHAERLLQNLGAIDSKIGKVTDVGRELTHYPVNPRFGKMLLLGMRNGVLSHTVALVAGLAVGDLFIPEPQMATRNANGDPDNDSSDGEASRRLDLVENSAVLKRKQGFGRAHATLSGWDDRSDAIKLLTAVAAHAQAGIENNTTFCAEYFLREKGMTEVQQLRRQLHNIMQNQVKPGQDVTFQSVLPPPSPKEISALKQIVAAGFLDHVAIRADLLPTAVPGHKPRRAIEVAYRPLLPSVSDSDIDRTSSLEDQQRQQSVFVHASSLLAKLAANEMPTYIVYSNLSRAPANAVGEKAKRTRMHPLVTVGPKQMAALAENTPLLDIGKPIGKIEDRDGGKRRECWVGVSLRDPSGVGTTGWSLGAWKVLQARKGKEWAIEKVIDRGK